MYQLVTTLNVTSYKFSTLKHLQRKI